jgi:hypothetical protein
MGEPTSTPSAVATGRSRAALTSVLVAVNVVAAAQGWLLGRDMLLGDGSARRLLVPLRYEPMRVPPGSAAPSAEADGRLAADFGAVYFPACAAAPLEEAYRADTTADPWKRPARSAPAVLLACRVTLCRLSYGAAALIHVAAQWLLFLASVHHAMRRLNLARHAFAAITFVNALVFLTPVGLSSLERGQFTLYVGLAYLWGMLALTEGRARDAGLAALFGFAKWTSFPFLLVALGGHALGARTLRELRRRAIQPAVAGGIALALTLALPAAGLAAVRGMLEQEATAFPEGISLVLLVPRPLVKALPLLLLLLAAAWSRRGAHRGTLGSAPLLAGVGVVLATYPTLAFDYSAPYLAAFLPFLVAWARDAAADARAARAVPIAFALALLAACLMTRPLDVSKVAAVRWYLAAGVLLVAAPLLTRRGAREVPARGV